MQQILSILFVFSGILAFGQEIDTTRYENQFHTITYGDTITHTYFYENGPVQRKYKNVHDSVDANNIIYHHESHYCKNGQLKFTREQPHDTLQPYTAYHCNGNIAVYSDSSDFLGDSDGIVKYYHPEGTLEMVVKVKYTTESIKKSQKHVFWTQYFDKNGTIEKVEQFDQFGNLIEVKE